MRDDPHKPSFDPRSPVQPDRSPAPYFLAAFVLAIVIWTVQQHWVQDSNPATSLGQDSAALPSSASEPTRGDVRTLFSTDDYPAEALRKREQGTVQARLDVDERGRVRRCIVIRSSGYASLDTATCGILQRRARFTPARDVNGKAVTDTVVTPPVTWRLEG